MDYDFDRIRAQLETATVGGPDGGDDDDDLATQGSWLSESWNEPQRFWRALTHYHAGLSSPAPKSHPGEGFDFYYDLVLRHRPERVAMRCYSRQSGWRMLSYRDLDVRSTALADDWAQRGLQPGTGVCLLLPMGEDFVIALLTALRLGLQISYLPPLGARFVTKRLAKLPDVTVVTIPMCLPLVAGARVILVTDVVGGRSAARRLLYSYAPDAVVGKFFSELVDPSDTPLPVSAHQLYLAALRDALLHLGLRPGDMTAAPGMSPLQHQPSLIIGTLLCGATWVHVELEDLANEPSLLTSQPLRAVGISSAARDILLRAGAGAHRGWSYWYRNPEEPFDHDAWRRLIRRLQLEKVLAGNLLVDASVGGSVLWSPRKRGQVHAEVLPAAGRPWSLASTTGTDIEGNGPRAMGDFGLFAPAQPARIPYLILVRAGGHFLYGGTRTARCSGRVYPVREVAAIARALPSVVDATVVLDRAGRFGQPVRILVAFTGAVRPDVEDERTLAQNIAHSLGAEFVPDHIQLVPLYPRMRGDEVDPRWCESQQVSGMFYHKPRHAPYQLLTLLRRAIKVHGNAERNP
jgi:AMP-binding enzyme